MNKFDLHIHTTLSDGDLTPSEISKILRNTGIAVITDHDNPLYHELKGVHLCPFRGVELSTYITIGGEQQAVEFLAYGFDETGLKLFDLQESRVVAQELIYKELINILTEKGCKLFNVHEFNRAKLFAHSQIYPSLTDISVLEHNQTILSTISLDTAASFYHTAQSPGSTIRVNSVPENSPEMLRERADMCGAKLFLAHPIYYKAKNTDKLIEACLPYIDGIECLHPSATKDQARRLLNVTASKGLMASGGSDYHKGVYMGTPYHELSEVYMNSFSWIYKLTAGVPDWWA